MAALVDGMAAARKLSASLGGKVGEPIAVKDVAPEYRQEALRKAQEGPQEAPGAFQTATDGQDIVVTVRVPLKALWAFLKGVADGN